MALLVQKYGGTSVGTIERIEAVAEKIIGYKQQGHDMVVVVSAMSGQTNRLIELVLGIFAVDIALLFFSPKAEAEFFGNWAPADIVSITYNNAPDGFSKGRSAVEDGDFVKADLAFKLGDSKPIRIEPGKSGLLKGPGGEDIVALPVLISQSSPVGRHRRKQAEEFPDCPLRVP